LRHDVVALNKVLVDQFIASQGERAPDGRILDVDAADMAPHGQQEHNRSTSRFTGVSASR